MPTTKQRRSPVPTQAEVRASVRKCTYKPCRKCIHFSEETDGTSICWCSSRESIITWDPERHTCDFYHNGVECKKHIQAEFDFSRMSIEAWLKKHSKGK